MNMPTFTGKPLTPAENKCYGGGNTWQEAQSCIARTKEEAHYQARLENLISPTPTKMTGFAGEAMKPVVKRLKAQQAKLGNTPEINRAIVRREIIHETATPETHPGGFLGALDRIGNTASNFLGDTTEHIIQGVGDVIKVVQPYMPAILGALVGGEYISAAIGGAEAGGGTAEAATASSSGAAASTVGGLTGGQALGSTAVAGAAGSSLFAAPAATGAQALGSVAVGGGAASAIGEIGSGVSAVGSALSSGWGTAASDLVGWAGSALSGAGEIAAFLSGLMKFIIATIDDVDKFAKLINKDIIDRFVRPITQVINTVQNLEQTIHDSLSEGFSGIVKIPGEIVDAFSGIAAISRLNTQETIKAQSRIASDILAKGYPDIAIKGLSDIHQVIKDYTALSPEELKPLPKLDLKEPPSYDSGMQGAEQFMAQLAKSDKWYAKLGLELVHLLNFIPIWALNMEVATKQGRQKINEAQPLEILNSNDLITAIIRDEIPLADAEEEALKGGLDPSRLKLLVEINKQLLGPGEIVHAVFRGLMESEDAMEEMKRLGYSEERTKIIRDLYTLLPSPGQALRWFGRGFLSHGDLQEILSKNGITEDQEEMVIASAFTPVSASQYTQQYGRINAVKAGYLRESLGSKPPDEVYFAHQENLNGEKEAELNWLNHWDDLSSSDWISAYFRKLISKEDLDTALRAHNLPHELLDLSVEINRELIPIWLVPEIMSSGVITAEESYSMLSKLGIGDADIKVIQKSAKAKAAGPIRQHLESLAQLSLSNLKTMFDLGLINSSQYSQGLTEHGYTPTSAQMLVKLEDVKKELKERSKLAEGIIAEINVGLILPEKGLEKLYNLGFSTGEIAIYSERIKQVKAKRHKIPSESQLNKLLKKGIITEVEWADEMLLLGFDSEWISRLLMLQQTGP